MDREYYLKNRDKLLQQSKERYVKRKQELLQYQREYRAKNKKLVAQRNKNKRNSRLLKAIELLGGKCNRCNQVYDPCVYDFHHVDPTEKEFTIGENMLVGESRFFEEIKKCILLCANCHRLTHKEA